MRSIALLRAGIIATLPLLTGCATESVFVRVLRPAPVNFGRYELVAIDRFEGTGGNHVERELTDTLTRTRNPFTGETSFEVLDRRAVDRMLEDLRRNPERSAEGRAVSLLERWRKAELVIQGSVEQHSVEDTIREEEATDADGNRVLALTRQCVAHVVVLLRAVEPRTERVLDEIRFQDRVAKSKQAIGAQPNPIDHERLLASARRRVIGRYVARVLPREETVRIHLYRDGDLPELEIGNGFARSGDWERAVATYREALERSAGDLADTRYKSLYNLGVGLAYSNDFEGARRYLKEAYALEQDSMILQQLTAVGHRENEYQRLVEQSRKGVQRNAAPKQ